MKLANACWKHPHSSEASSKRCYQQQLRRRAKFADRRIEASGALYGIRLRQVRHVPPVVVDYGGGLEVVYFFSAEPAWSR